MLHRNNRTKSGENGNGTIDAAAYYNFVVVLFLQPVFRAEAGKASKNGLRKAGVSAGFKTSGS